MGSGVSPGASWVSLASSSYTFTQDDLSVRATVKNRNISEDLVSSLFAALAAGSQLKLSSDPHGHRGESEAPTLR